MSNIVRTWTEHCEHEHSIHVRVRRLLEPNLIVQVQVQAQDPRTRTEPNPGQSNGNARTSITGGAGSFGVTLTPGIRTSPINRTRNIPLSLLWVGFKLEVRNPSQASWSAPWAVPDNIKPLYTTGTIQYFVCIILYTYSYTHWTITIHCIQVLSFFRPSPFLNYYSTYGKSHQL